MESRNLSKPVGPAAQNDNDDGQPSASADAGDTQASLDNQDHSSDDADGAIDEASAREMEELEEALEGAANSTGSHQSSDLPKPGDTLH